MASLKSITAKKKKAPVVTGRKSITAEERHIGVETVDWTNVQDVHRAMTDTLRHYNYFYDYKDAFKWAASWVKKYRTKEDYAAYMKCNQKYISTAIGGMCKMHQNGAPLTEKQVQWIHGKITEAILWSSRKASDDEEEVAPVKTIASIVKSNTSDFIAEIEAVLDDYYRGIWLDIENYSIYNELKKIDAPANTAKVVMEYYAPIKQEIEELIQKKTPDLVEAYKNMTLAKKKEYLKLLTLIVDDAEKYINSKKAIRKTRVAKPKSASQQVAKVQYLKESAEYKLTSVDPMNIVGASELYLFNVKYRTLAHVMTQSASGFTLKGTTLQGIDAANTSKKMVRKPNEMLKEFMSATKARASRLYADIKTTASEFTGRINSETIILKVYK